MNARAVLRRKCGCGGSCGSCDKEKRELRRSAIDTNRRNDAVPRSVTRVLGSGGAPLDATVRRTLEPRFGHDFSSVRVHTGDEASRSAADVHARAWTVGNDIAFARGHYAPHTRGGLQLLAHELTHVVQQSSTPQTSSLTVGDTDDQAEAEADATAARVMGSGIAAVANRSGAFLRGDFDVATWDTTAADVTDRPLVGEELDKAEAVTGTKAPATPQVPPGVRATFVLHDTDANFSLHHIVNDHATLKGPQGLGVAGMMPRPSGFGKTRKDPDLVDTRTAIFELRRPTATGWEKGDDDPANGLPKQTQRVNAFRALWKVVSEPEREEVLTRALDNWGLDQKQIDRIKRGARAFLGGTNDPGIDGSATTASWACKSVCSDAEFLGSASVVATPGTEKTVDDNCAILNPWFAERTRRVANTTNVEIVQRPRGQVLDDPPYSEKQYDGVATLYIRAALAAHKWPYITTHNALDHGAHHDPRCFDVGKLYRTIATKMGTSADTTYGIDPSYGPHPPDNVWWNESTCHGKAPK